MQKINTVRGPISGDQVGKTLIHEHFIFGYPGYQGDITLGAFDGEGALKASLETAQKVKRHGVKTVVDATPNECGRDPKFLREVAEKSDLNIICSTGYYYEGEGAPAYFKLRSTLGDIEKEIYDMFEQELTVGIGKTGIKAGVIKLASNRDEITPYERAFFTAAAKISNKLGVPIITHTQEGKQGPEQAALLLSQGADPAHVMIGHMGGNTDIEYHLSVLEQGVYIAFDRFGLQGIKGVPVNDNRRIASVVGLLALGYAPKILLSHDSIWLGRPFAVPGLISQFLPSWHPTHIFEDIIPLFQQAGITEEQVDTMLVKNPQALLSVT